MKTINLFFFVVLSLFILNSCNKDKDNDPVESEAKSAQFYKPAFTLAVGGREKVMLTLDTENAVLKNPKWKSTNLVVAKVDSSGVVMALAAGEVTISLTADNNISGSCKVTVVESPIKNLVMPEAKYPLAKDALIFILGNGFTSNSKIILRPHSDYKPGLKSASDAGDILVQISETTANYISFYLKTNSGLYNVILNEKGEELDLGNIEIETPNLPEYEYDKNKIFWEDTHWRWFQLRGKVQKIDIALKDWYTFNGETHMSVHSPSHVIYNFNTNGRLTNELSYLYYNGSPLANSYDEFKYEYDSKNRLIKLSNIFANVLYSTEFEYGNHNLYYPLVLYFPAIDNLQGSGYNDDRECWIKGLTKITYGSSVSFTIGENSINTEYKTIDYISKCSFSYNANSYFPSSYSEVCKGVASSIWDSSVSRSYKFSNTGIPLSITTLYKGQTSYLNSVENSPFYLNSDYSSNKYQYDANWNISKIVFGSVSLTYYYTSYDVFGNWTECTFIKKYDNEQIASNIYKITRDITYW